MAVAFKDNHVSFTPDPWTGTAPVIWLKCGGPITRRGGLEPDCWCFTVPFTAVDALTTTGVIVGEISGILKFWYTPSATDPDVSLGNVAIVDVQPEEVGREPGDTVDKVISYRISIADHRRAWVAPRGGLLFDGKINTPSYAEATTPKTNLELLQACVDAMRVTTSISGTTDDVDPAEQVDCSPAHAASELQRLLEYTGTVFAPLISGQAQIVTPGTASPPTVPTGRLIRDTVCTSVDRRSGIVVFTSAPAAKIRSFDDAAADPNLPTWKYVALDPDDQIWKPVDSISVFGDPAADQWAAWPQFDDSSYSTTTSIIAQIYRCIQLDPTKYPPGKVQLLTQFVDVDLTLSPVRINHASMLVRQRDGSYKKDADGWVRAEKVIPELNIIIFEHRLMKIASGTQTRRIRPSAQEVCIPEAELKPHFSVEGWDSTGHHREYGTYGALVSAGHATSIPEATAKTYLTGYRPNISILHAPDLMNVLLNGGTTTGNRNTEAMQDRAEKYASSALGTTTPATRIITVKGFWAVEIDACVSEVTYDPQAVTTTLVCNGWHVTARTSGVAVEVGGASGGGA